MSYNRRHGRDAGKMADTGHMGATITGAVPFEKCFRAAGLFHFCTGLESVI